jgi:hypothetical protein
MQVASAAGQARYNLPIGTVLGQDGKPEPDPSTAALLGGMSPAALQQAASRLASADQNDPSVKAARAFIADEIQSRQKGTVKARASAATAAKQQTAAQTKAARVAAAAAKAAQTAAAKQARAQTVAQNKAAAAAKKTAAQRVAAQKKAVAAAKKTATAKKAAAKKAKPKKAAAAASPHWFSRPAQRQEITLSSLVGYSGLGPRITDRFGQAMSNASTGQLATRPTGDDSGQGGGTEGGEGTGPDSPGSGTWLKVNDVHAPRGPRSNARKLGEVHRRVGGAGKPYRAVRPSGTVISYHHSPERAVAAVMGDSNG